MPQTDVLLARQLEGSQLSASADKGQQKRVPCERARQPGNESGECGVAEAVWAAEDDGVPSDVGSKDHVQAGRLEQCNCRVSALALQPLLV